MPLQQVLYFRSAIQSGPCIAATFVLFIFISASHCEYILFSTWMSDKEECYLLDVHADEPPPRCVVCRNPDIIRISLTRLPVRYFGLITQCNEQ